MYNNRPSANELKPKNKQHRDMSELMEQSMKLDKEYDHANIVRKAQILVKKKQLSEELEKEYLKKKR